ncbi:AMP-binding protein [Alteromonas gilva]|uniref:AMP-binding protein n=1 Tax=Alteromonas gilva TaxID=2987522 RepID=A0ABT5L4B6_9ALTE|nr:AMP-binding protein [Alteromonas gilva]MDC8831880.1 AMP-binding protein [Alteromonas gilva]
MNFLTLQAKLRPTKEAVIDLTSDRSWTYPEWESFVNKSSYWLTRQGLACGDRLACLAKNCAELVALHFACEQIGVLFVPLNWRLSAEELHALIDDCTPRLIVGDTMANKLGLAYFDINTLSDAVSLPEGQFQPQDHRAMPSLILYTSGTTGQPKGIMHSQDTIMETTLNMTLLGQVDEHSTFLCETPMFHVIGLISCVRPALYQGGRIVISDGFQPPRTLARLMDEQLCISHYFCVPQMANALRQEPDFNPASLQNLKALLTGGAPHPAVQIRQWLNDGIPIVDGYGMSEAGTVFGMPFDIATIDTKAGSVGVPTHRIEVRLADAKGQPVANGETGEVQLKGKNLFTGIWQQPQLYAQCFTADGWFKTGDVAVKDDDDFYRIVDRIKDMFISGGENVYPTEIEGVAVKLDAILECALVGVPDDRWGEVGCLFVVAKSNQAPIKPQDILDALESSLAKYKLPKYIKMVDSLPRNGGGKVMKHQLKALFSLRRDA